MENKNLHKDHRKRVREDFLAHGFDEKTPFHKVIEMLLFYCIPRKDTNDIAHLIENRFKNLETLFEASPEELKAIDGINDNTVAFFKLLVYITKRYRSENVPKHTAFHSIDEIANFLFNKYTGETREVFGVTSLTNKGQYIAFDVIKRGDVSSVGVSVREVIELVLKTNATSVILSHNHPNGSALPSPEDIALTERIAEGLANIDVKLIDHIIITEDDYVSLAVSANFKYLFNRENE